MATDDDIALSLPEPPPPRPARREAAIDEALRRFDATGEPPRVVDPPRAAGPPPWWTTIRRPQVGVLVSAALVAVIGLPMAWISLGHQPATVSPETPSRVIDGAVPPGATAPEPVTSPSPRISAASPPPPATASRQQPAPVAAPSPKLAASRKAPCEAADCAAGFSARTTANAASPSAPPAMKVAQGNAAPAPPPPPPPAPPAPMMRAEQAYRSGADREARVAGARAPSPPAMAAPAPPPPPATAVAADEAGSGDVVVTAARRRAADSAVSEIVVTGSAVRTPARRGDWNACTLNDPSHSLSDCRKLVDPGAKGPEGRAAAHLADGLSLGWEGDFDGAIAAFDQAIEIRPRLSFAYLNRGLAYQRKGELARAIADLDRAVRYTPGAARGYYNRSLLLRQRGDAARASADEDRAVDLDPRYEAVVK